MSGKQYSLYIHTSDRPKPAGARGISPDTSFGRCSAT